MIRLKKVVGALSVILLVVAFAALAAYATAPEEQRMNVAETIGSLGGGEQERKIDWDALPPEVIAWVEVPGTSIDEPIAQAVVDAPNAYLYEDALGQGAYGTPYIDCECALDSPFVMIYGHNMSDGSAFANFIDEAYAREHDEVILYQRGGESLHLKPVAVDVIDASRETLIIKQDLYPSERIAGSDILLEAPPDEHQHFAFTTCSYQTRNSRTTVYASLSSSGLVFSRR